MKIFASILALLVGMGIYAGASEKTNPAAVVTTSRPDSSTITSFSVQNSSYADAHLSDWLSAAHSQQVMPTFVQPPVESPLFINHPVQFAVAEEENAVVDKASGSSVRSRVTHSRRCRFYCREYCAVCCLPFACCSHEIEESECGRACQSCCCLVEVGGAACISGIFTLLFAACFLRRK